MASPEAKRMVRGVKMLGIYHPFSRALYEQDVEGNVLVTDNEKTGLFRANGSWICLLYTSPSPRDRTRSRMPSSA